MSFETPSEKIFKQLNIKAVTIPFEYIEYGQDFVRFRDHEGRLMEIKVTERKPRKINLSYPASEIKRINKKYDKKK